MKELTFEDIASMYDPLIKSFIRRYHLTSQFNHYYQTGLIGLWNAYKTFDEEKGAFSSYAYLIVRGQMLQELKKDIKKQEKEELHDQTESLVLKQLAISDTIPYLEEDTLNTYLKHLTENQKRWVIHRVIQMMSEAEIAERYNVTVYAVKSWRKSAIKKLRKIVEKLAT